MTTPDNTDTELPWNEEVVETICNNVATQNIWGMQSQVEDLLLDAVEKVLLCLVVNARRDDVIEWDPLMELVGKIRADSVAGLRELFIENPAWGRYVWEHNL